MRMSIAQRAVLVRRDQVGWQKADVLVQTEAALLDRVQRGHHDGQLVDGLHGERGGGMEITVECAPGERASHSDAP